MFGRRKKDTRTPEEKGEEDVEFVHHLIAATVPSMLEGGEASRDDALAHLSADIQGAPRVLLERAVGYMVIQEANAVARDVSEAAAGVLQRLMDGLKDDEGATTPEERPEDATAAESTVSEDVPAGTYDDPERTWAEDRR